MWGGGRATRLGITDVGVGDGKSSTDKVGDEGVGDIDFEGRGIVAAPVQGVGDRGDVYALWQEGAQVGEGGVEVDHFIQVFRRQPRSHGINDSGHVGPVQEVRIEGHAHGCTSAHGKSDQGPFVGVVTEKVEVGIRHKRVDAFADGGNGGVALEGLVLPTPAAIGDAIHQDVDGVVFEEAGWGCNSRGRCVRYRLDHAGKRRLYSAGRGWVQMP